MKFRTSCWGFDLGTVCCLISSLCLLIGSTHCLEGWSVLIWVVESPKRGRICSVSDLVAHLPTEDPFLPDRHQHTFVGIFTVEDVMEAVQEIFSVWRLYCV